MEAWQSKQSVVPTELALTDHARRGIGRSIIAIWERDELLLGQHAEHRRVEALRRLGIDDGPL